MLVVTVVLQQKDTNQNQSEEGLGGGKHGVSVILRPGNHPGIPVGDHIAEDLPSREEEPSFRVVIGLQFGHIGVLN